MLTSLHHKPRGTISILVSINNRSTQATTVLYYNMTSTYIIYMHLCSR